MVEKLSRQAVENSVQNKLVYLASLAGRYFLRQLSRFEARPYYSDQMVPQS